jgi:hypothetical protein
MIRCAGGAWLKRGFVRKDCTSANDEPATRRVGPLRKNLRMNHEGKCGTQDLCGGQSIYLSSGQQTHVGSAVRLKKILYAIFRREVAKQVVGTSSGLRKIRKWILWRGRPPPKRKKKRQIQEQPGMWEQWPLHEL